MLYRYLFEHQVTLSELKVSADPDNPVFTDDSVDLVGQTTSSSSPSSENYWLFILALALLLMLWLCCLCWVSKKAYSTSYLGDTTINIYSTISSNRIN